MGRRTLALLSVVGLAGFLLASGALAPVIAAAVRSEPFPGGAMAPVSAWSGSTGTTYDWTDDPWMHGEDDWSQVPGPRRPASPAIPSRPTTTVPEKIRRVLRPGAAINEFELKLAPMRSCPQQHGPGRDVRNLTVVAGAGSVAVSWWDLGDRDTRSYVLTAVPQRGSTSPLVRADAPAPDGCQTVRSTIRGLVPGVSYRVWVNAVTVSPVNQREYRFTRGQSDTFVAL